MDKTTKQITVEDTIIHITQHNKEGYISLTDMLKHKFKLLVIREFQRLKEIESNQYNLEWNG